MNYRLIVVRGRSAAQAIPLKDAVTVAGRQEDCQLRISSSQVSRRHCQFFEQKGYLIVKDLGSSNGTMVNGKRINGQRVLDNNDVVNIGPIEFRVEKLETAPPASTAKKPGDTVVPVDDLGAIPIEGDDLIQVEIDDVAAPGEATIQHTPVAPQKAPSPAKPSTAKPAPAKPAPAKGATDPASDGSAPTIEFGDDDVADFLLELDIDDDTEKKKS